MNPKTQKIADQLIKEHELIGYSSTNINRLAAEAGLEPLQRREAEKLFALPLHYRGYTFTYSSPKADLKARLGLLADRKCNDCLDTGWKWSETTSQFIPCHCPAKRE